MDNTYLEPTQPRHPSAVKLAELLRRAREMGDEVRIPKAVPLLGGTGLGELVLGQAPEGIERVGYGERLTKGSGETLQLRPEVLDAGLLASGPATSAVKAAPRAASLAARLAEAAVTPVPRELATRGAITVRGLKGTTRAEQLGEVIPAAGEALKANKKVATVKNPHSVTFPEVYDDPRELVSRAVVAPEDPLLKQLFGVTRDDLFDIAQQGTRKGNLTEPPFEIGAKARGSKPAEDVTNPRNTQRLINIIEASRERPDLFKGMASWYTMDPLYQRMVELFGPERAGAEFKRFNTLTGMASPGSEVLTELNRGTAANWLDKEGRFGDFLKYGGVADEARGAGFPDDMRGVLGHAYHKTAQAAPMEKYLRSGEVEMQSAKVPSYIQASSVPEVGFQTAYPVGDAHWSRIVGLPDVRGLIAAPGKGGLKTQSVASAERPEMITLAPWWRDKVAAQAGLESVPAQAVVWGAGSNATGVTSPIGAPKLELLAQQIGKTARRLNVSPEQARDMVLMGKTHAGVADPALLGGMAAGAGGAAALAKYLREQQQQAPEEVTP